jgi:hypothetical protein
MGRQVTVRHVKFARLEYQDGRRRFSSGVTAVGQSAAGSSSLWTIFKPGPFKDSKPNSRLDQVVAFTLAPQIGRGQISPKIESPNLSHP